MNFYPNRVERNRKYSFGILQLPPNDTEREIKVQYWKLAETYHLNKYDISECVVDIFLELVYMGKLFSFLTISPGINLM